MGLLLVVLSGQWAAAGGLPIAACPGLAHLAKLGFMLHGQLLEQPAASCSPSLMACNVLPMPLLTADAGGGRTVASQW